MTTFIRYTCDRFTAAVGPFEDRAAADEWALSMDREGPETLVAWDTFPPVLAVQWQRDGRTLTPRQATERAWFADGGLCGSINAASGAPCHKPQGHDLLHHGWAHYPGQLVVWGDGLHYYVKPLEPEEADR